MGWWCINSASQNEDMEYPPYWNQSGELAHRGFAELYPGDVAREHVQELINDTFRKRSTRDRHSAMPNSLQVMAVVRMENATLWRKYAAKREKIRKARRRSGVQSSPWQEQTAPPKTAGSLHCLDEEVQESYLFHGTTANAALQIQHQGFCLNYAREGFFGRGIYFAEATSKADEYAGDDNDDIHVMLVSRVVRGVVQRVQSPDRDLHKKLNRKKYDSILGDREAAVGTYREYVVYDEAQAYPEYAVIYRRMFVEGPSIPPLLLRTNEDVACSDMVVLRDTGDKPHRVVPVPTNLKEYMKNAVGCTARTFVSGGSGFPNVLLADSTGDGEFDVQMMTVSQKLDGALRRTWVPIPIDLEFPLAALRGDLCTVKAHADSKTNLAEPLLHGMTALSLARVHGHTEIVEFLQETYRARRMCPENPHAQQTKVEKRSKFRETYISSMQQNLPVEAARGCVNEKTQETQEASRLDAQAAAENARMELEARLEALTIRSLSSTAKPCPQRLLFGKLSESNCVEGEDETSVEDDQVDLDLPPASIGGELFDELGKGSPSGSEYWEWNCDLLPLGEIPDERKAGNDELHSLSTASGFGDASSEVTDAFGYADTSSDVSACDSVAPCEKTIGETADIEGSKIDMDADIFSCEKVFLPDLLGIPTRC